MFDIGFSEILMVALVSLLVIGPERLPKVARIAGFWIGKTRRMIAAAKAEISAELHAEEFRQALKHEEEMKYLQDSLDEARNSVMTLKSEIERLPQDNADENTSRHDRT